MTLGNEPVEELQGRCLGQTSQCQRCSLGRYCLRNGVSQRQSRQRCMTAGAKRCRGPQPDFVVSIVQRRAACELGHRVRGQVLHKHRQVAQADARQGIFMAVSVQARGWVLCRREVRCKIDDPPHARHERDHVRIDRTHVAVQQAGAERASVLADQGQRGLPSSLVQEREGMRFAAVHTDARIELRISRGPAVVVLVGRAAMQLDVVWPPTGSLNEYAHRCRAMPCPRFGVRRVSTGILDLDDEAVDLAAIPHARAMVPSPPPDLFKAQACCGDLPGLGARRRPLLGAPEEGEEERGQPHRQCAEEDESDQEALHAR